jgi:hypothetical protein
VAYALLAVLQQPGIEPAAATMAAHQLVQLATGSTTTLNFLVDGVRILPDSFR